MALADRIAVCGSDNGGRRGWGDGGLGVAVEVAVMVAVALAPPLVFSLSLLLSFLLLISGYYLYGLDWDSDHLG